MRQFFVPALFALAATVALAVPAGTVRAEPVESLTDGGRYQLMEINDKIVRLDTRTGRFQLCRMEGDDWTCLAAKDERQKLMATISSLTKRIEAIEEARRGENAGEVKIFKVAEAPAREPAPENQQAAAPQSQTLNPQDLESEEPVPANTIPPSTGKPFDISPDAIARAEADDKPGLFGRITGLVSNLGW